MVAPADKVGVEINDETTVEEFTEHCNTWRLATINIIYTDRPLITYTDRPLKTYTDGTLITYTDRTLITYTDGPLITYTDGTLITYTDGTLITYTDGTLITYTDRHTINGRHRVVRFTELQPQCSLYLLSILKRT